MFKPQHSLLGCSQYNIINIKHLQCSMFRNASHCAAIFMWIVVTFFKILEPFKNKIMQYKDAVHGVLLRKVCLTCGCEDFQRNSPHTQWKQSTLRLFKVYSFICKKKHCIFRQINYITKCISLYKDFVSSLCWDRNYINAQRDSGSFTVITSFRYWNLMWRVCGMCECFCVCVHYSACGSTIWPSVANCEN